MKINSLTVATLCFCGLMGLCGPGASGRPRYRPAGIWEIQKTGVKDDLRALAFVDAKQGWAVGANSTILRTRDGGKTWRRTLGKAGGVRLDHVLFTSAREGWAASGILGTILHTKDGGDSWRAVPLPARGGFGFMSQSAVGSAYFVVYLASVYCTDDGGKSWRTLADKLPHNNYTGLWFADLKRGCLVRGGEVLMTEDGGKSWRERRFEDRKEASGNYMLAQFADVKNGWIIPHYGTIHATSDGGRTWRVQDLGHARSSPLIALHFMDARVGHVLVGHSVRRTTDGGKSWKLLEGLPKAPGYIRALSFPAREQGWVAGDKGFIAHYRNSPENQP